MNISPSRRIAPYRLLILAAVVTVGCLFTALPAHAQSILFKADDTRLVDKFHWIPYAFFSESFGLGFGVGAGYTGWPRPETTLLGTATLGTKGSYNFALGASDLRVYPFQRLYMKPFAMLGKYQDQWLYVGQNNPGFEGQRAGANDSDQENFLEVTQWDNRIDLEFRYLLPMGHGAGDEIVNKYVMRRGLLVEGATGGESWNPLESGRTYLNLTPAWREQTLKNDDLDVPLETFNAQLELERDNRDFPFNAQRGSYQRVAYQRDFTNEDALGGWEFWSLELSKVFDLGASDHALQRVIAIAGETGYVPTWETEVVDGQEVVTKRPPQYEAARLGGLYRMRGFEDSRFQDKAVVYYSAEYRAIPAWQPLRDVKMLDFADIQYWQWVLFAEVGQVAPHWNVSGLHDDLHFDGGISLRGMLHSAVCRLDIAVSEEGSRVTAMYGQPF